MNPSIVQKELTAGLVREGLLLKRNNKLSKDWEERWTVLTTNYIFIYQDKSKRVLTDSIDLVTIKNYKSYVRKEEDVSTSALKIRSDDNMYYLSFTSPEEKWSWMVTLERLMDFKVLGKSKYNCEEWIRTRGFRGQLEFEQNATSLQSDNQYKREIERLNKQLLEQENYFANVLKSKYKELNAIEQKMITREKKYEELTQQLVAANTQLKLEEDRKAAPLPSVQPASIPVEVQVVAPENKKQLPRVNHEIKSFYQFDILESMVGYSVSPSETKNVTLSTKIIEEEHPKPKDNPSPTVPSGKEAKANVLETVLGYSIPPAQQSTILVQSKAIEVAVQEEEVDEAALENARLREEVGGLLAKEKQFKAEIQHLQHSLDERKAELHQSRQQYELRQHALQGEVRSLQNQLKEVQETNQNNIQQAPEKEENEQILNVELNIIHLPQEEEEFIVEVIVEDSPKSAYPSTSHEVKSFYQFDLVQSMVGYSVPHSERERVQLRTNVIDESHPRVEQKRQEGQHVPANGGGKIDVIETILGFSISPSHYHTIHHGKREEEVVENQEHAVDIDYEEIVASMKQEILNLTLLLSEANQQLENSKIIISSQPKEEEYLQPVQIESQLSKITIKQHQKHEIVESFIGYSLSPAAQQNLLLRAQIIEEPVQIVEVVVTTGRKKRQEGTRIDHVETILGFSIPISEYFSIQTQQNFGQSSKVITKSEQATLSIEELRQQLNALTINQQELKAENERFHKALEEKELIFDSERKELKREKLETQAVHLKIEKELQQKLKEYQDLFAQFEAKHNVITSKPIESLLVASEVKKEIKNVEEKIIKPSESVPLIKSSSKKEEELPKPSWVKHSNSKYEGLPVWVKVRPDDDEPSSPNKSQLELLALSKKESGGHVSEMKKLFESIYSLPKEEKSNIKSSKATVQKSQLEQQRE